MRAGVVVTASPGVEDLAVQAEELGRLHSFWVYDTPMVHGDPFVALGLCAKATSRTLPGIAQEIYALLGAYQLIRLAITGATRAVPGADPDRAGFTIALQTARDQVIQATNVIAGTAIAARSLKAVSRCVSVNWLGDSGRRGTRAGYGRRRRVGRVGEESSRWRGRVGAAELLGDDPIHRGGPHPPPSCQITGKRSMGAE